jgi:hypothetical protein
MVTDMATAIKIEPQESRVEFALQRAGLSRPQAAKKLNCGKATLDKAIAAEDFAPFKLGDVFAFAKLLRVDVRWLMRGLPSPAAIAAIAEVGRLREEKLGGWHFMPKAEFDTLRSWLRSMPQPDLAEAEQFTCRYCGCTPFQACAEGCEWVDSKCTICSACLKPGDA